MEDIFNNIAKWKKLKEHKKLDKENGKLKKKLEDLKKENGKLYIKQDKKPKVKIPEGFRLIKIPENLDDIPISILRGWHYEMFGKEPPHDTGIGKIWIANKIKAVLK